MRSLILIFSLLVAFSCKVSKDKIQLPEDVTCETNSKEDYSLCWKMTNIGLLEITIYDHTKLIYENKGFRGTVKWTDDYTVKFSATTTLPDTENESMGGYFLDVKTLKKSTNEIKNQNL